MRLRTFVPSWLRQGRARQSIFRHLVAQADRARDGRRHQAAATLYAEALALRPLRSDLLIQQGHMLKESGDYAAAEAAYLIAAERRPEDADLQLQFGHLYRVSDKPALAADAYRRAAALRPGWIVPQQQLETLAADQEAAPPASCPADTTFAAEAVARTRLAPELVAGSHASAGQRVREGLRVVQLGRLGRGPDGTQLVMQGVEAVRGWCLSARPVTAVTLKIDGIVLIEEVPRSVPPPPGADRLHRSVFNLWFDASTLKAGQHVVDVCCRDDAGDTFRHGARVYVLPGFAAEAINSNAAVPIEEGDPLQLEARIRSLPSVVRAAGKTGLPQAARAILVMRTDQLGDMVASIPALQMLRAAFPIAKIVGLVTSANHDLAATLDVFDELLSIDFPDDPVEQRRIMSLDVQEALRERLAGYCFDIAIDLAESSVSRPLLLLSGARFLYGAGGDEWPWLTAAMSLRTHDPRNGMDIVPHGAKIAALVGALAALVEHRPAFVRPAALNRARLASLSLPPDRDYVVLHTGARIAFSRWPHFGRLAARLLAETDWVVVLVMAEAAPPEDLPSWAADHPALRLVTSTLRFDEFDALISFAQMVVGNDSGPKHLASLRGVPAVTLFTARINWQEWGQEQGGVTISRRVPCAGCALFHHPEECGRNFTCIRDIDVEEVLAAMLAVAAEGGLAAQASRISEERSAPAGGD